MQMLRTSRYLRRSFSLLSCSIILWVSLFSITQAQSSQGEGGLTVIPLSAPPARLRAQIVDVTLAVEGMAINAHVETLLQLDTTGDQVQSIDLRVGGMAASAVHTETVKLSVDDKPLTLHPADSPALFQSQMVLSPGRPVKLRLSYEQNLGNGPLISFAYALSAAAWPTQDGSARIRLRLPPGVPREAWLLAEPVPTQFDGEAVTWHFDRAVPDVQVHMQFVHPAVWQKIATLITEAGEANAVQTQLASLLELAAVDAPNGPAFQRFYPIALAQIARAIQTMPHQPEPHLALARLYLLNQDTGGNLSLAYATLVAAEAQAAARAGAPAEDVNPLFQQAFRRLVNHARDVGDWPEALDYLDRLREVGQDATAVEEERQTLLHNVATSYLRDGHWTEAARIVRDTWGISEVDRIPSPPWLGSVVAQVETESDKRTIIMQIYPAPGRDEEAATQVRRAVESLRAVGEAQATALAADGRIELQITLPLRDAARFLTLGRALANVLPPQPEWAFLGQLLRPETLRWEQSGNWLRQRVDYAETVDLRPPVDVWRSHASQIEQEAQQVTSGQPEPVASLMRELGRVSAEAWRDLSQRMQVRYVLHLAPAGVARSPLQWLLLPDERRQLTVTDEEILPWLMRWFR